MLKSYSEIQEEKGAQPSIPAIPSGVACDEKNCDGEMYLWEPQISHPQYNQLHRASCIKCGWRGWI